MQTVQIRIAWTKEESDRQTDRQTDRQRQVI